MIGIQMNIEYTLAHNSSDFCDEEVTEVGNKILWACIAALLYHNLY